MTLTDALNRAELLAREWARPVTVCRHPVTGDHVTATIGELSAPKDWATNPAGFPNVCHVVAVCTPTATAMY